MNYAHTAFIALSLPTALFGMATNLFDKVSPHRHPTEPSIYYKNPLNNPAVYREESLTTLKALLAEGKYAIDEEDKKYTGQPLETAIGTKRSSAVKLLLEYGANPNRVSKILIPDTPLTWCIDFAVPEITELLLKNGASPNLATEKYHPLFYPLWNTMFCKAQVRNIAILLREGIRPLSANHRGETIFQYMKRQFAVQKNFIEKSKNTPPLFHWDTLDYLKPKALLYQKVGRALVQYKILFNHLHRNWHPLGTGGCLHTEIVEHILTFVDFDLDNITPMAKCAICYDEKEFRTIPCSKNTHTDSICGDCISKLTDCPLCREKLSK